MLSYYMNKGVAARENPPAYERDTDPTSDARDEIRSENPGRFEKKALRYLDSHNVSDCELRKRYLTMARQLDSYERGSLTPAQELWQARIEFIFGDKKGFPKRESDEEDKEYSAFAALILTLLAVVIISGLLSAAIGL